MFLAGRLLGQITVLRGTVEPDVAFETHALEIEYLRKSGEANQAFEKIAHLFDQFRERQDNGMIDASADAMAQDSSIIAAQTHRIRLLIIKANMWAHVGRAPKGFSVALRAANAAYTSMLMPLFWAAISALATILDQLQEFEAAQQLLDSIIPKAIEGADVMLVAQLYSKLTDAYVGRAFKDHISGSKEREQLLNTAQMYLERAKEGTLIIVPASRKSSAPLQGT